MQLFCVIKWEFVIIQSRNLRIHGAYEITFIETVFFKLRNASAQFVYSQLLRNPKKLPTEQ